MRTTIISLLLSATGILQASSIQNSITFCVGTCEITVPATASNINFSDTLTRNGVSVDLEAATRTKFGTMKAFGSYANTAPNDVNGQINVVSSYLDELTIDAPGLTGQTGYLLLSFMVTGSESLSGLAQVGVNTAGGAANSPFQLVTGGTAVNLDPVEFVFGTQFGMQTYLGAILFIGGGLPTSGFADYFNTSVLTQFLPVVSDGVTPASNVTIIAASGTQYTPSGVVPEPGTFALILPAIVGIAWAGRRKLSK